ncbi:MULTISPECIES: ABC transporter permease [unclassified Paenibacillus]|uniref:ABC transporter permease n=1 Tax=unclassified Paenibacillus TaxID=185978 RepID=UPI0008D54C13|nr:MULTISPECIES: ABC transporter permease [unclassified Paenibacillus]QLG40729.1 ABC transporter permease [Paenibacillus sp. E222]SEN58623.1 putative ABC transport system permease protein [Paenibacillus sp. OK076]
MHKYTRLTEKYLLGQKKRSILTIVGIILSVTLLTAVGTLAISYQDKLIRQTTQEYGDYEVSFKGVPGKDVSRIINHAVIGSAGVLHRVGYAAISSTSEKEKKENPFSAPYRYLNVKGYDSEAMNKLQIQLESGRLPQKDNEIILSSWSLEYFASKPTIGDNITLNLGDRLVASTGKVKSANTIGDYGWDLDEKFQPRTKQKYTVVGIMKPAKNVTWSSTFIYSAITYDDHQKTDPSKTYFIYATMKSMDNIREKSEAILSSLAWGKVDQGAAQALNREAVSKNASIEFNNELLKLYGKSTYKNVNQSSLLAFSAIVLIIMGCTSAVIYNTFHISVLERISQFGMLRCIGATPDQIRKIVLKEAAILSLVAIPIGLFTGTILMKVLFYNISLLTLGFLNDMHMIVSLPVMVAAAGLGLLTVYVSALGPAKMASSVSPLEALKASGSTVIEPGSFKRQSYMSSRWLGFEGRFASRNIRRNKKRFRITAFSMIISIVLYIVFSGLASYLETTSASGIDYSYSLEYEGASKRIPNAVYTNMTTLDAVDQAYTFYNHQVQAIIPKEKVNPEYYKDRKGMYTVEKENGYRTDNNYLVSYGINGLHELRTKLTSGSINVSQMNDENGVIVIQKISMTTEQGKRMIIDQTRFKVGDRIPVRSLEGDREYKMLTVVGIADKEPLSKGYGESAVLEWITTPQVIENITGDNSYGRILIQANPEADNKPITSYLKSLVQKDAAYSYRDRVEEMKQDQNDAKTLDIFLYGFIGVIVAIAFLNILNTVSTNLILRTKEFAVLKAIGMTQREIGKMVLLEGVFYGVFAAVYGSLLGTGLSYGVAYLMRNAVQLEWVIPWSSIGMASLGAIAATLMASYWPLRRLGRVKITDGLRGEN